MTTYVPVQDSGSLAVFKVTAGDQGQYKGPSGAFVTYCNISCFILTSIRCKVAPEYFETYLSYLPVNDLRENTQVCVLRKLKH